MLSKSVSQQWTAPLFAAALAVIELVTYFSVTPRSFEPGLFTFFCFLPMAFFFAASAQSANQKQVNELQQRIERLEAQVQANTKPVGESGRANHG